MDNEEAQVWLKKIESGNKAYKDWSIKYKTDQLEQYYEGFQYADSNCDAYTINLFFATIETKQPSLLFQNPCFNVAPKPKDIIVDPEQAFSIASNLEDSLNEIITNNAVVYGDEVEATLYDSWFRFGIMEIGYSADWIDNPNLRKPIIKSDYKNVSYTPNRVKYQTERIPVNEQLYFKNVPSRTFRVSTIDARYLHRCNWCGYYEFVRLEDLLANKNLRNLDKVEFSGYRSEEHFEDSYEERDKLYRSGDYVKIWKIWDLRSRQKYIISETHSQILRKSHYDIFPLVDFRFKKRQTKFYPLPPSFNWISPQNELNETREANRMHRRRFKRMYQTVRGAVDRDEFEKLLSGPDGGFIEVERQDSIAAIPNADLGTSAAIAMQTSKDDFNIMAATTSEQRGEADRTTATQATITNQRASVRENRERIQVANFLVRTAEVALETIRRKFVNNMVVSRKQISEETGIESTNVREINPLVDLGDDEFSYNVNISLDTLSPIANDEEKNKFVEFLTLLSQFPQFAMSPILVRELAFRVGYKNERAINEFQRMAQLQMIGMMEQQKQGIAQMMGQAPQQTQQAQMQPPGLEQLISQIQGQGQLV